MEVACELVSYDSCSLQESRGESGMARTTFDNSLNTSLQHTYNHLQPFGPSPPSRKENERIIRPVHLQLQRFTTIYDHTITHHAPKKKIKDLFVSFSGQRVPISDLFFFISSSSFAFQTPPNRSVYSTPNSDGEGG